MIRKRVRKSTLLCAELLCAGLVFTTAAGGCASSGQNQGKRERHHIEETNDAQERADAAEVSFAADLLSPAENGFLPPYWYAGDHGKKPAVRRQYSQSNCWAVAAASALESSVLPRWGAPSVLLQQDTALLLPQQGMQFSPDHFVYRNAFTIDPDAGGSYYMAMAYLSGWQGPVLQEYDPYGDMKSPEGLSPAAHVQEIRIFEEADEDRLKEAVMKYGAVQASLYLSREQTQTDEPYYNEMTSAYYYPEKMTQNHDIVILGWDDSYSRFLFKNIPARDGAFICQNSWGEDFGEDGIFYVSYEDANLGVMAAAYSRVESVDNYDRIYQADDCGWQSSQGYGSDTCWFANVYTAEADESLAAVGFYATGRNARYEVWLVHDFLGEASFAKKELLAQGSFADIGYYTVDLADKPALLAGERFAVAVKLETPENMSPAAVEYAGDPDTQNVVLEGKEGYLSLNGKNWQNTEQSFGTNVCLKAYTQEELSE